MFCGKCGAEIPDGSTFCSSCGAPVSGEAPKRAEESQVSKSVDRAVEWVKSDTAGAIILFGALLLILGAFLPWSTKGGANWVGVDPGLNGAVICALGVVLLGILVLSRTSTNTSWLAVMIILNFLILALTSQSIYQLKDWDHSCGFGVWLCLIGVIIGLFGAGYELWGPRKK